MLRLYTIQNADAWHQKPFGDSFMRNNKDGIEPSFLQAYDWMSLQLKRKIKQYNCMYPVWAWKHRPDLRSRIRYGSRNTRLVLVEFEVEPVETIESHFEAWHFALNNWYLPDDFRKLRNIVNQEEKYASWERIFNIKWALKKFGKHSETQFCVEQIKNTQIISEKFFTV